jgi:PAS domain S-box-containing protein
VIERITHEEGAMLLPYQFTPYMLPMLASAVFSFALAIYGWRRRAVPGALPFSILMTLVALSLIGTIFQEAARDEPTKIFWFKVQYFLQGPIVFAGLYFVMEYAHLNPFLNRLTLTAMCVIILVASLLIITNDVHHWVWLGFREAFDGTVQSLDNTGYLILTAIGLLAAFTNLPILIWLFIRSPQHRLPVAVILCGQLSVRTAYLLDIANINTFAPIALSLLALNFRALMYAIALFGLRIFDPVPMARRTAIEQMREGMIVLDAHWNIADLNPAAEKIFAVRAMRAKGRKASQVLPTYMDAPMQLDEPGAAYSEITLGTGSAARIYSLHLSPLSDPRGFALGYLILLYDVTEQKQAQSQLVEQQRVMATLEERERLARELHDSVGQVLGYANLQLGATRKLLDDGQTAIANGQLARLSHIIQDAHADVREHILNLSVTAFSSQPFFTALQNYLDGFSQNYGIATRLIVDKGFDAGTFAPETQMQLFRIIQEALSNARKHAAARSVQVQFELAASHACITIQDDGRGFDPAFLNDEGTHAPHPFGSAGVKRFGLRFMRARAEQMGGNLSVDSMPGAGARIVVQVPVKR